MPRRLLTTLAAVCCATGCALSGGEATPTTHVQVPFSVGEMQADPGRDVVYLLDRSTPALLAVSTASGRPVGRVPIDQDTSGLLAVSPDGRTLYLTMPDARRIARFALPGLDPLPAWRCGFQPYGIAVKAGRVYVTSGSGDRTRVLDAGSGEVLGQFGPPRPPGAPLRTDPQGTRLFVPAAVPGAIGPDEYDIGGRRMPRLIVQHGMVSAGVNDLSISTALGHVYACENGVSAVRVLDLAGGTEQAWQLDGRPGMAVAQRDGGDHVYAGSGGPGGTIVRFGRDGSESARFAIPAEVALRPRGLALTANGRLLYAASDGVGPQSTLGAIGLSALASAVHPTAGIAASPTIGPGPLTVEFDGTGSTDPDAGGGIVSWQWSFEDGRIAHGAHVRRTFSRSGEHRVRLTVTDAEGLQGWATTTVIVNRAPTAKPARVAGAEDKALPIRLAGSDPDGDALNFAIVRTPTKGTLAVAGHDVVFTPDSNVHGEDSFDFVVSDAWSTSQPATVRISIAPRNDPPVAEEASVMVRRDEPRPIRLGASDIDSVDLRYAITRRPAHGTLTRSAADPARWTYTPHPGFVGPDSFGWKAEDDQGATGLADASIAVMRPDTAPGDSWSSFGNGPAHTGAQPVQAGGPGVWSLAWSRSYEHGWPSQVAVQDGVAYTTCSDGYMPSLLDAIDVSTGARIWSRDFGPGWLTPAAAIGDRIYVHWKTGPVGGGDEGNLFCLSAGDGTTVWQAPCAETLSRLTSPTVLDGRLFLVGVNPSDPYASGLFAFDRASGERRFFLNGPRWGSNDYQSATAPCDQGQIVTYGRGLLRVLEATTGAQLWSLDMPDDAASEFRPPDPVIEGGRAYIATKAAGALTIHAVDLVSRRLAWTARHAGFLRPHGKLAIAGGVLYVRVGGGMLAVDTSSGARQMLYRTGRGLSGAQPLVTDDLLVLPVLDGIEIYELGTWYPRQSIPRHGHISFARDTLFVTGDLHEVRAYRRSGTNRPPVLSPPLTVHTVEDQAARVPLVASDPEGDRLEWSTLARPSRGDFHAFTYAPHADVNGSDVFVVTVSDGQLTASAEVRVEIAPVNDAPVAHDRGVAAKAGEARVVTGLATDVDGDALTLAIVTQPAHGVATADGDRLIYTPAPGFVGHDTLRFRASDGQADSAVATLSLNVLEPDLGTWALLGNDVGRTGYAPGSVGVGTLTRIWSTPLPTQSRLAVGDGRVYVMQMPADGIDFFKIVALDATTGVELWRGSPPTSLAGDPSFADGRVLVQRSFGSGEPDALLALDATTGGQRWSANHMVDWGILPPVFAPPLIAQGRVHAPGGNGGELTTFAAATGAALSTRSLGGRGFWTPSADANAIYAWTGAQLHALDPVSGATAWTMEVDRGAHGVPVIAGGKAFLVSEWPAGLTAIDLATRTVAWSYPTSAYGIPAVAHGVVYVCTSTRDGIQALDATTGAPLMLYPSSDREELRQPLVGDGLLVVPSTMSTAVFRIGDPTPIQVIEQGGRAALTATTLYIAGRDWYTFDRYVSAYRLPLAAPAPATPTGDG